MLTRFLFILGVFTGIALPTAEARRLAPPRPYTAPPVHVEVVDRRGNAYPVHSHRGQQYIEGRHGRRYKIRVSNPTAWRVEVVVSVDGLDVIDGKKANYRTKRGYVIPAYGHVDIDGWRRSKSQVAAFRFSSVANSYASLKGKGRHVGVIGVAVFREQRRHRRRLKRKLHAGESRSRSQRAPESHGLGTGWGETRESRVEYTRFVRASQQPSQVVTMRYNDRQGLRAMGVPLFNNSHWRHTAEPFPGMGFAEPPPGYSH